MRWRVGSATVAHLFGGEDQRFRVVLRAEPDEVAAFEAMGEPYFRAGWGSDVVGLVLDEADWDEVEELLVASYCVQAQRPGRGGPADLGPGPSGQVPGPGRPWECLGSTRCCAVA